MKDINKMLKPLICLYIIIMPLIPGGLKIGKIPISGDIILAFIILIYLISLLTSSKSRQRFFFGIKDFFKNPISFFMTLLFIIMLISTTYALDKKISISESLRFATYIALFFIIKYECNDKKATDGMLKSYGFTALILSIMGVVQFFTGYGLDEKFKNFSYARAKIAVTLDNPNNLAAFMILAVFPIIMITIYEKNKTKKILYGFCSVLITISLVLTFSRNVIIGFAVGSIVLVLLYSWKMIFPIALLGTGFLFIPQILSRVKGILDPVQNQSRLYLWHIALKMVKDHPILGVGNGNYVSRYDEYVLKYPEYAFFGYTKYPCHNSYLKVLSELGVIGCTVFLALIVSILYKIKKFISVTREEAYKFYYEGVFAAMVAFLVMNLADNLFFVPKTTVFFWILLAIEEAAYIRIKKSYVFGG